MTAAPAGPCVVDTNVAVVANHAARPDDKPEDLPEGCVSACVEAIASLMKGRQLVLDEGDEILDEYADYLCRSGQPGVGDAFMKWVCTHQYGGKHVVLQRIVSDGEESYKEFPPHPGLEQFDNADRKFVAVANAHPKNPVILQAIDSKWWGWRGALRESGVEVHFLCEDYVKAKYPGKTKAS